MGRVPWLLGLVLLLGVGARADDMPASGPNGPCAADIALFCKDTARGEGRLRTCLKAHAAELATECRVRIQAQPIAPGTRRQPAMGPHAMNACGKDLRTHCAGVPSGGGRLLACLESHAEVLTPRCKAVVARPAPAPATK